MMDRDDDRRTTWFAWTTSVLLHAVTLGTALVLAVDFSSIPRPRPFQWDVTLVSAASADPITTDNPASWTAAAPSSLAPATASPRTPATASASPTAARVASEPVDLPRMDASPEALLLDQLATELLQHTSPDLPPLEESPTDTVDTNVGLSPSFAGRDATADSRSELAGVLPVSQPGPAEVPPPDVESPDRSDTASEPAIKEPLRVAHRPLPQERAPISSRSLHADYGWLVSLLHTRIEALKQYPQHAKVRRWQGQVLLQAAIHEDGRMDGVTVVESSGHHLLDREAIALLERASPMSLSHPLGQPRIVLQIPIAYRLE